MNVVEARGVRPREQESARFGLARVAARDFAVQRQPAIDRGLVRVPAEGAIVTVARRDQPTRPAHALHLAQRANGVGEMLEHLMRVHDVERVVVHLEGVEVADRELDVRTGAGVASRLVDHGGRRIDAEDASGRNSPADVRRDRARPAPEVEHAARQGRSYALLRAASFYRPSFALVSTSASPPT